MIPDGDHEVVYERVAAVDVAKASGGGVHEAARPGTAGAVRQPDLG